MLGVFLTLFSYMLHYPAWVGPLVMMGLMGILFALPLPILYHRSRLWLAKICVSKGSFLILLPVIHSQTNSPARPLFSHPPFLSSSSFLSPPLTPPILSPIHLPFPIVLLFLSLAFARFFCIPIGSNFTCPNLPRELC